MKKSQAALATIAMMGVLVLAGATAVFAHPFDSSFHSARATVKLDEKRGLRVQVVLEVPASTILQRFLELYGDPTQLSEEANEIFRQDQFKRFVKELRLKVNGKKPAGSWEPMDDPINGLGTADFFVYMFEFMPEDPVGWLEPRMTVRLNLEVFPQEYLYLTATSRAKAPWQVVESSADKILDTSPEDLLDPETGQWSVDPRLRNLKVVFEKQVEADAAANDAANDASDGGR